MAKTRVTYAIQSQSLTDIDSFGNRQKEIRYFRPRFWVRADNVVANFRDAVLFSIRRLNSQHIGTIVYSVMLIDGRPQEYLTKLAQFKWGHDQQPFIQYEGPVGHWFKREAGV